MEIIFDRAQMAWAVQRELKLEKKDSVLLRTAVQMYVRRSPAAALTDMELIYFQGEMPESLVPLILNHEELHILTHRIMKKDLGKRKADRGTKFIDNPLFTRLLCEVFEISPTDLIDYLRGYVLDRMPIIGTLRKLVRRIKEGLKRNSRK